MAKAKEKYEPPVLTKVKFEDKALVAFNVCKKQSQLENESASCCNILPFKTYNMTNFDAS